MNVYTPIYDTYNEQHQFMPIISDEWNRISNNKRDNVNANLNSKLTMIVDQFTTQPKYVKCQLNQSISKFLENNSQMLVQMYFYKEISWIIQELKHSTRKGRNIVTWGPPHLNYFPFFYENLSALSV